MRPAVGAVLTRPSPMSRGLQCGLPVPLAPCSRTQAPRVGGLGASFRSEWGGGGSRRRQAHEQGLAACGAAVRGHSVGYSEGYSEGLSGGYSGVFPGSFPGRLPCRSFQRVFRRLSRPLPHQVSHLTPRPPKPPQANGLCSWAVRRLPAPPPCQKRNAAPPPPARGVGVRRIRAEGTGRLK